LSLRPEENPGQANRHPVHDRRIDEQRREAPALLDQAGEIWSDRPAAIPLAGPYKIKIGE
jgi:hypothetical protein